MDEVTQKAAAKHTCSRPVNTRTNTYDTRSEIPQTIRRIAIVGSREGVDPQAVRAFVDRLDPLTTVVISGGAVGVDSVAAEHARKRKIRVVEIRPNWKKYGRVAGFHRNGEIVKCCDDIAAFWNGKSRGTLDTVKKGMKANKPVALLDSGGNLLVASEYVPPPTMSSSIKTRNAR